MDGTQKIPQRWLDTALALTAAGQKPDAIIAGLNAWLWHLEDGRFVDDPYGQELTALIVADGRPGVIARCFAGVDGVEPLWPGYGGFANALFAGWGSERG